MTSFSLNNSKLTQTAKNYKMLSIYKLCYDFVQKFSTLYRLISQFCEEKCEIFLTTSK